MRLSNRCDGLIAGYTRVLFQELVQCFAAFQILNQYFEGNTGSAKNRFTTENVLIPDDRTLHLQLLSAYRFRAARYAFHGSQ
jgi:hypothetical protein